MVYCMTFILHTVRPYGLMSGVPLICLSDCFIAPSVGMNELRTSGLPRGSLGGFEKVINFRLGCQCVNINLNTYDSNMHVIFLLLNIK